MSQPSTPAPSTGILHLSDILERHQINSIFFVPEDQTNDIIAQLNNQLVKNGVVFDLRLGSEVFLSGEDKPRLLTEAYPHISIKPGQFALLTTYEIIDVPLDLFAFISMRFTTKQGGLINVSGFHADPGYQGILIYSVYNAGPRPLPLKYKDEVFMIVFSSLTRKLTERPVKYRDRKLRLDQGQLSQIIGATISPELLNERIHKLEMWNKINWGLALSLVGSIIAVIATFFGKIVSAIFGGT